MPALTRPICTLVLALAGCDAIEVHDDVELPRLAPVPTLPPAPNLCPNDNALYDSAVPGSGFCSYDAGKYSESSDITAITCAPYTGVDGIARHLTTCSWRWEKRLKAEPFLVDFTAPDATTCGGFAVPLTPCSDHVVGSDESYTVSAPGACPASGPPWFNDWGVDQWKECAFEYPVPAMPTPSKNREASLGTCCSSPGGTCSGQYDPGEDEGPFPIAPYCLPKRNDCKPGFEPAYPWGTPGCMCHCDPVAPPGPGESSGEGDASEGDASEGEGAEGVWLFDAG